MTQDPLDQIQKGSGISKRDGRKAVTRTCHFLENACYASVRDLLEIKRIPEMSQRLKPNRTIRTSCNLNCKSKDDDSH